MEKPMGWVQPQEGEMGTEAEALRSAMPMELEKGVCYLVKEKKPELSFRLFEMLLAQKIPSLCITRQYPDRVRRERGLTDVRIIWLSHTPGEDYHNPTAIGTLAKVIQKFIEDNNGEGAEREELIPRAVGYGAPGRMLGPPAVPGDLGRGFAQRHGQVDSGRDVCAGRARGDFRDAVEDGEPERRSRWIEEEQHPRSRDDAGQARVVAIEELDVFLREEPLRLEGDEVAEDL